MKNENFSTKSQIEQEALSEMFEQLDIYGLSIAVSRLISLAAKNIENPQEAMAMLHSANTVNKVVECAINYLKK